MSHFLTMVVTNDGSEDSIKRALQPYHEYECTDVDDEYVVELDKTDKVRKSWDLCDEKQRYGDIQTYGKKYYGYQSRDDPSKNPSIRFIRKTNPNAKWDWWTIGGRWENQLKDMRSDRWCNSMQKENIDFDFMRQKKLNNRRKTVADVFDEVRSGGNYTYDEVIQMHRRYRLEVDRLYEIHSNRRESSEDIPSKFWVWIKYSKDPDCAWLSAASQVLKPVIGIMSPIPDRVNNIPKWIDNTQPLEFWAALINGQWIEKREMGWFGASFGEKDDIEWMAKDIPAIIDMVDDGQWITMVDCHI